MTPQEEAISICASIDTDENGEALTLENDGDERGATLKAKILRLRQLIAAM